MQLKVPNKIFLILIAFKTPLYFTATNKPCTGNPIQCFWYVFMCEALKILMMMNHGAKILFKWVHYGVFNVSLRASSAELGGALTDLLWSKNVI